MRLHLEDTFSSSVHDDGKQAIQIDNTPAFKAVGNGMYCIWPKKIGNNERNIIYRKTTIPKNQRNLEPTTSLRSFGGSVYKGQNGSSAAQAASPLVTKVHHGTGDTQQGPKAVPKQLHAYVLP